VAQKGLNFMLPSSDMKKTELPNRAQIPFIYDLWEIKVKLFYCGTQFASFMNIEIIARFESGASLTA
jgi:hypothetical protein